ncbi:MAG: squalene synthase HpnD [Acidobacteria bacterium]|nr:MAG: squalene synthase HpnD [Acidobacteriota bacterium]
MAVSSAATSNPRLTNALATNFYYSFIFLPREKREAVEAVYAFARRGDDLADGAFSPERAAREIALHREALDRCYSGAVPNHGEARAGRELSALSHAIRRYRLPRRPFEDLILGLQMDLAMDRSAVRYHTFDELEVYCHRVAGTIGLICIEIFGYRDPRARDYALDLGTALQLVNILRDLQSDARRGRIYLPREDLERFGVEPTSLVEGRMSDSFVELMQFECDRARQFFRNARRNLAQEDRRSLVAAEIMGAIYWRLLRQIERRAYNVFGKPIRLSRPVKFWTALSVYVGGEWHK